MTNISTLADRYADLDAEIKGLQRMQAELKTEIKALGCEEIVGERAIVSLSLSERSTLDTKLVRELLTEEQVEVCTKVSLVETIRCKAVKAPKQIA
jgi:transcription-repair coupling factor (superfamily II helicase)